MSFDFLKENYEEPFFDTTITFPQITFEKTMSFDQFYSRSQFGLQQIKLFKLPSKVKNVLFSQLSIINYPALISFYRNSELNDNQKLLTIAFITTYVGEFKLYEQFTDDIDILFQPLVFPTNPANSDHFNFTQNIDLFLLDYIYQTEDKASKNKSKALVLYEQIYSYWCSAESDTILNFMPLLIQLLYQWKSSNFFTIFKQSRLFTKILSAAQDSYLIFNFVWNCVQIYPDDFFQSKTGLSTISFYFFKPDYRAEVATFLDTALKVANQGIPIQKEVFQIISTIISSFVGKEDPEAIVILFDMVTNCFPDLQLHLIQDAFQTSIFDQMAKIAISSIQYFNKFLFFLVKIGTEYYDFIEFYGKKLSIHNTLCQFQCDKVPLFELFKFAFCSNVTKDYSHQYIRNWTAINLILKIFVNNEGSCVSQEEEIVQNLLKLSQNKGNLIELNRAKTPEFILQRFPKIQSNEDIRGKYLTLFSTITISIFDNTTFYRTIELLKDPTFQHPIEILDKLNQNLTSITRNSNRNIQSVPKKFFRFDNPKGCGIFGPTVKLSASFSIYFWIRLNDIVNKVSFPLLFFDFSWSQICFEFEETQLYVLDSKKRERHKFNFEFEQGKWYYIVITHQWFFLYDNISLYVNNNKESEVRLSHKLRNPLYRECTLSVCSKSSDPNSPSLLCDLSNLYVVNTADQSLDFQNMVKNSPDLIACNYNPSNAHEGQCFNVTQSGDRPVPYKGRTIPAISILENVVKTVGAVENFFPLFDRLSSNPLHLTAKVSTECGSIYLRHLISITSQMISISESNFYDNGFIELFASFLNDCDPTFLTVSVINELSNLFSLKNDEVRSQMMQYVFLNYEIASRLDCSSLSKLFETVLEQFISEGHKYIYEFDFDLLIYKTNVYFSEESKTSDNAWIFLRHVLLSDPFSVKEIIESLIMNLSLFRSNYSTGKIVDLLLVLISEDSIGFFKRFNFYSPFIVTISESSTSSQISSLDCILKLSKLAGFDLNRAVDEIVEVLNKNDDDFDLFIDHLEKLLIADDGSQLNTFLLPLLVKSASLCSEHKKVTLIDSLKQIVTKNPDVCISLFDFKLWFSYLLNLLELLYDPNEDCEKISSFFADLYTLELTKGQFNDFPDFFNYLIFRSFEKKVSYTKLKSSILTGILHRNIFVNNYDKFLAVFSASFEFLVFEIGVITTNNDMRLSFQMNSPKLTKTDLFMKPASLLIKLASQLNSTVRILGTVDVNIVLAAAFIAFTVFEANSEESDNFISEVTKQFDVLDEETREQCNLIITYSMCPTEDFGLIRSTWFQSILLHSDKVMKEKEAKIDQIRTEINKRKIECIGSDENSPIAKRLVSVSSPNFFSFFYAENDLYLSSQKVKLEIELKMLIKLKKSFLLDISKVPGPWYDADDEVKFKALNRISRHGQRILMTVNKRFDDHHIASSNRDRKLEQEVSKENFYYKQIKQTPFIHETKVFTTEVTLRILWKQIRGTLNVSAQMIHFLSEMKTFSIEWPKIEFILNRRVANIDNSCEIFTISGRSYFIIFSNDERKRLYSYISRLNINLNVNSNTNSKFDFFSSLRSICQSIYQNKSSIELIQKLRLTNLWKNRDITNYSYIYYLNLLSGRSFNDSKQYPIYPILIMNTDSDTFDFNDLNSYRDLTIPTAFVCSKQPNVPASLNSYNQLPSNEFLTSWSLVRVEPFTSFQITTQGDKFLEAARQLYSIKNCRSLMNRSIVTNEDIPEYFTFPYLYVNENRFDLGIRPIDKILVDDVVLPNWSKNAYIFTFTNRIALESDISNKFIHKWIDLFFGVHRHFFRGRKLYPYFAYQESLDSNYEDNCEEDNEIHFDENIRISNCEEFGTMPAQLFNNLHDERGEVSVVKSPPNIAHFKSNNNIIRILKNVIACVGMNKAFIINDSKDTPLSELNLPPGIGDLLCVSRKFNLAFFGTKDDPFLTVINTNLGVVKTSFHHNSIINAATVAAGRYLITGSNDCSLYVWDLESDKKGPLSSSGFHSDYITSIGCCYENGLLVSADKSSILVFETLIDHKFIAAVSIDQISKMKKKSDLKTDPNEHTQISQNKNNDEINNNYTEKLDESKNSIKKKTANNTEADNDEYFVPQIVVFKSGTVCVSQKRNIIWLDSHAKVISTTKLDGNFLEMHKYYDYDTREILIVGSSPKFIDFIDVTTFGIFARIKIYQFHFYPIRNTRSILVSSLNELRIFNFGDSIPTFIKNYKENESPLIKILKE